MTLINYQHGLIYAPQMAWVQNIMLYFFVQRAACMHGSTRWQVISNFWNPYILKIWVQLEYIFYNAHFYCVDIHMHKAEMGKRTVTAHFKNKYALWRNVFKLHWILNQLNALWKIIFQSASKVYITVISYVDFQRTLKKTIYTKKRTLGSFVCNI